MKFACLTFLGFCLGSFFAHGQDASSGGTIVSDIFKEWDDSQGRQPFGSWEFYRGPAKMNSAADLSSFDRFESGVSGNPNRDIWSWGSSIFNVPAVTRDKGVSKQAVFIHPEKDGDRDQGKGSVYVQWTSAAQQRVKIELGFQNVGTDVKGGDGMTIRIFERTGPDASSAELLTTIALPNALGSTQPLNKELVLDVDQGQQILVEVDPNIDGYGDNLAFTATVYRLSQNP